MADRTDYDASRFQPPAPIADVTLRNADTGATVAGVLLLLDTGADVTLLPRAAVERIFVSLPGGERQELIGFDGSRSSAPVVVLDMLFLRRAFRGPYLLIDNETGVLGRDVRNHLTLLLDGPQQRWSQHPSMR